MCGDLGEIGDLGTGEVWGRYREMWGRCGEVRSREGVPDSPIVTVKHWEIWGGMGRYGEIWGGIPTVMVSLFAITGTMLTYGCSRFINSMSAPKTQKKNKSGRTKEEKKTTSLGGRRP